MGLLAHLSHTRGVVTAFLSPGSTIDSEHAVVVLEHCGRQSGALYAYCHVGVGRIILHDAVADRRRDVPPGRATAARGKR